MFFSRIPQFRGRHRGGFTLLEVVLALSLSVVVLFIIAGGLRMHARMVASKQAGVREDELARALLRQISRDLESAVATGAPAVTSNNVSADGDLGAIEQDDAQPDAVAAGDTQMAADDAAAEDALVDPNLQSAIGLYGTINSVRFETIRAESAAQLQSAWMQQEWMGSLVPRCELQTVGYFLADPNLPTAQPDLTQQILQRNWTRDDQSREGGWVLMRSVVDYNVHAYLVENGGAQLAQSTARIVAPEVRDLQFAYFDGLQWLSDWDSSAAGGLPLAVRVTIALWDPGAPMANGGVVHASASSARGTSMGAVGSSSAMGLNPMAPHTYSMIVRLPAGQVTYDPEQGEGP